MLDIHYVSSHREQVIRGLQKKHFENAAEAVSELLAIDQRCRMTQASLDSVLAQLNRHSEHIGQMVRQGKETAAYSAQATSLKQASKELTQQLRACKSTLRQAAYALPNLPHAEVPEGKDAADNVVVYQGGPAPSQDASLSPHWELVERYGLVDFASGNKIMGAGFPVYRGRGARLQRALINFFLDEALRAGYEEVQPPVLVNEASAYGTGQLPDKEGHMYRLQDTDCYLIPTSEIPLTNLYRDEILPSHVLPIKHVAYTPCFRREAGSWGSHVRGLNRLHQFDKVELMQIALPESSSAVLRSMCVYVQQLLDKLALPYRVVKLCGRDLGFSASLTYDVEVWAAGQQRWLEVSSISNFETYQARRMRLRYKDGQHEPRLLHTLNGSALALPRVMAALLENNQTAHGIDVPRTIQAYVGFKVIA